MKSPKILQKSAFVALVAPARWVIPNEIEKAVTWLNQHDFKAIYDNRLFACYNQFAGDDTFRAAVFQDYINRSDIDAIWLARGGYGGLRIVDNLDFTEFCKHPKWIIGYSDSTVFHGKLQKLDFESLHATMPINVPDNSDTALQSLYDALIGKPLHYVFSSHILNRIGQVEAEIVGGNLSVLYSMLGSDSFPDLKGKILFLEDLDEYLYHVDRMVLALKRAGKLSDLAGLVVGGMSGMHDNTVSFGMTAEAIIASHTAEYGYPMCCGFPAGHFADNRTIVMGRNAKLQIEAQEVSFWQ